MTDDIFAGVVWPIYRAEAEKIVAAALRATLPGRLDCGAVSLADPNVIIAGIKQFGLAADGSDLRDLSAAIARLSHPQTEPGK